VVRDKSHAGEDAAEHLGSDASSRRTRKFFG